MAATALYAGKINQMPSLTGEVRKSVEDYSSELFSLETLMTGCDKMESYIAENSDKRKDTKCKSVNMAEISTFSYGRIRISKAS